MSFSLQMLLNCICIEHNLGQKEQVSHNHILIFLSSSTSNTGFDRDIFSGSPSLQHLIDTYTPKLSPEEQSYIDNQVTHLCTLLNDHEVVTNKDFSKEAWDYMRDEKFFGMKIPKVCSSFLH